MLAQPEKMDPCSCLTSGLRQRPWDGTGISTHAAIQKCQDHSEGVLLEPRHGDGVRGTREAVPLPGAHGPGGKAQAAEVEWAAGET